MGILTELGFEATQEGFVSGVTESTVSEITDNLHPKSCMRRIAVNLGG